MATFLESAKKRPQQELELRQKLNSLRTDRTPTNSSTTPVSPTPLRSAERGGCNIQLLAAAFFLVGLLGGCTASRPSPREAFLSGLWEDRAHYHRLYEVSLEAIEAHEEELGRVTRAITRGVREESPLPAALEDRLRRIELTAQAFHADKLALVARLREAYVPATDSILFYQYWSDTRQEFGYMVTRGATVKRKVVLGQGIGKRELMELEFK